jgi:TatD DNase family protein
MMYIDTHAHLATEDFEDDCEAVIARARAAGVETMICPAESLASSKAAVRLANAFGLFAAIGIHPNCAQAAARGDWEQTAELVGQPGVVALGETGLDCHWDYTPMTVQQDYFDRHLRLSAESGLPVVVHCREAEAELLATLHAAADRTQGPLHGVIHACSGDPAFAAECLSLGLYISFAGNATYPNKKFEPIRAAAKTIPADRLLIETDSPFIVPQIFRGKQLRNEPANVVHTAAFLAQLRGVPVEQLAAETTANARRLFQLPGVD